MKNFNFKYLFICTIGVLFSFLSLAQNTISGTVTDEAGEPVIGASVVIDGTTEGTVTDIDGNFSLKTKTEYPLNIKVAYLGFEERIINVSGNGKIETVALKESSSVLDAVVISASRKREKVQEAPASISVITARKLETSANDTDPTRNLVSTPGVQVQQQSANRINISMRGSAGLFGTSVFPIMDYRSLVGPGIGTFQSDAAGISNIDLQKIEVVRGPGSALYGPGVTQGVVHFITKNPIDFPGTAIELLGGELNTLGAVARHAGRNENKTFGYKINAQYKRGNEFTLDPNDPMDSLQIAKFTTTGIAQPGVTEEGFVDVLLPTEQLLSFADLDKDNDGNPMANEWFNAAANATLEFRPSNKLGITVAGGYNQASSVFYNEQGEGLSQATEFWGQARVQAGGLFAQLFTVANDGGPKAKPTFLYQTGLRTPLGRTQIEGQVQYNFDTKSFLNSSWTAGVDYRFAGQQTENLVYGRNEDDDSYSVVGGYVQGKFAPLTNLDIVLAGRYDQFNFIDQGAFAPRAALVYKINPKHTMRASYNRANSTVSNLQLNIDFPLSTVIPGLFDVWLYGNKTEQTFAETPMISWFNPAIPDVPVGTPGLPTAVPFTTVNAQVAAAFREVPDIGELIESVLLGLNPLALGTTGTLSGGFNIFDSSPLGVINAPISTIATTDVWEVGYKGLIAEKLGVSVDIYHITEKNNSQFTAISPAYVLSGLDQLPADLGNAVSMAAEQPLLDALLNAGLPQEQAAATVESLLPQIQGAYEAGGDAFMNTPDPATNLTTAQIVGALPFHATVQTENSPVNGVTHLAAGYRTFDERDYFGSDIGLEYYVNSDLSVFGNYSWVSDNEFMQNVVGVEGDPLPSHLNIPKNKFRLGVNYYPELGFSGNLSFQHDDSYFANAGQFQGNTEVRNLVDAAVGYKFDFGLSLGLSATNVLNTKYRYLPNMPKIGRRVLGKVTYSF